MRERPREPRTRRPGPILRAVRLLQRPQVRVGLSRQLLALEQPAMPHTQRVKSALGDERQQREPRTTCTRTSTAATHATPVFKFEFSNVFPAMRCTGGQRLPPWSVDPPSPQEPRLGDVVGLAAVATAVSWLEVRDGVRAAVCERQDVVCDEWIVCRGWFAADGADPGGCDQGASGGLVGAVAAAGSLRMASAPVRPR